MVLPGAVIVAVVFAMVCIELESVYDLKRMGIINSILLFNSTFCAVENRASPKASPISKGVVK
jgi:hypothetical protein